jgi:hypothetical protein
MIGVHRMIQDRLDYFQTSLSFLRHFTASGKSGRRTVHLPPRGHLSRDNWRFSNSPVVAKF